MQETAIDWLKRKMAAISVMEMSGQIGFNEANAMSIEIMNDAKEMEKDQIVYAYLSGIMHPLEMEATKQSEQYYNETYGKDSTT